MVFLHVLPQWPHYVSRVFFGFFGALHPTPAAAWFCEGTEYECAYRNWGRKICAADGGTAVVTFSGRDSVCVCANTPYSPQSCEAAYERQQEKYERQQQLSQSPWPSTPVTPRSTNPVTPQATTPQTTPVQPQVTSGGLKIIKPSVWLTSTMYSYTIVECPVNPHPECGNYFAKLMREHGLFKRAFDHKCYVQCDPGYKPLYKGCEKI